MLVAKSPSRFLLTALQMDRIFDTRTIKGIKSALASMPAQLDELYREALVRIQKQSVNDGELGMRILSWITHAKRPLSVNELRYGLAIEYSDIQEDVEFDEDNVLSSGSLVDVCAGLVIIDSNSQVVRLAHYTTQEYLDKARNELFKGAEVDMSRACLTYLSYNTDTGIEDEKIRNELIASHPFLLYACHHWFSHAKNVLLAEDADPSLVETLARFKSSDSIRFWIHFLTVLSGHQNSFLLGDPDREGDTYPYEIASYLGLEDLVHVLLDRENRPYPSLDSSLVIASLNGHLDVARLLLKNGAAIESMLIHKSGVTLSALQGACLGGHLAVVEFLSENGADIHGSNSANLPPMHTAARYAYPDIVDLLLKKGVDVNARDSNGQTACHLAVYFRCMESTRRLIDAGCDLELRTNDGDTVLLVCESRTDPDIIDLLLNRGADARAKNANGKTLRNILQDALESVYLEKVSRNHRQNLERILEKLRRAEQLSFKEAVNAYHESEPPSSEQTVSSASIPSSTSTP